MLRKLGLCTLSALILGGCAQLTPDTLPEALPDDSNTPTAIEPNAFKLDPLLEAKDREQVTCESVTPLSAQTPLSGIVFSCASLGVQATIPQIRDAGWRMERMEVGQQTQQDGVITMPLRITIRKLF